MRRFTLFLIGAVFLAAWCPPAEAASWGYDALADWQGIAKLHTGVSSGLASSYDRLGGNNDYSQYDNDDPLGVQKDNQWHTVRTLTGPGVITRFWMPEKTSERIFNIKIYFDDSATAAIDTTSKDLFDGAYSYFSSPLVGSTCKGCVCYEPMAFSSKAVIRMQNKTLPESGWSSDRNYYQYNYQLLPGGSVTPSQTYSGSLTTAQQAKRQQVVDTLNNVGANPAGNNPSAIVLTRGQTTIPAGQGIDLAQTSGPGLIRRLNVKMAGASDAQLDGLKLRITWDNGAAPAVDMPVSAFFGAGHNRADYKSLPLGTDSDDGFYCYWPMPFDQSARVELVNTTGSLLTIDSAVVEYQQGQNEQGAAYFHAHHHKEEDYSPSNDYFQLLDVQGTGGHYVGNILSVSIDGDDFAPILEGDEIIDVDGNDDLTQYGTGLEDAYNGGYYYGWTGSAVGLTSDIGPYSGLLKCYEDSEGGTSYADQYRWLIPSPVMFEDSINIKMETYLSADSHWESTAFYYLIPESTSPIPGDANEDGQVTIADFLALQNHFNQAGGWADGDFNEDGQVTIADFLILQNNWGFGTAGAGAVPTIPEPASLTILAVGFGFVTRRKRR